MALSSPGVCHMGLTMCCCHVAMKYDGFPSLLWPRKELCVTGNLFPAMSFVRLFVPSFIHSSVCVSMLFSTAKGFPFCASCPVEPIRLRRFGSSLSLPQIPALHLQHMAHTHARMHTNLFRSQWKGRGTHQSFSHGRNKTWQQDLRLLILRV